MERNEDLNIQVPSGTAIEIPVSTSALPFAGTTVSFALYTSYPAAKAEPRVGALADGTSSLTRSWGGGVVVSGLAISEVSVVFLGRFARGEFGRDGGGCSVVAVEVVVSVCGGGVVSLVMIVSLEPVKS